MWTVLFMMLLKLFSTRVSEKNILLLLIIDSTSIHTVSSMCDLSSTASLTGLLCVSLVCTHQSVLHKNELCSQLQIIYAFSYVIYYFLIKLEY